MAFKNLLFLIFIFFSFTSKSQSNLVFSDIKTQVFNGSNTVTIPNGFVWKISSININMPSGLIGSSPGYSSYGSEYAEIDGVDIEVTFRSTNFNTSTSNYITPEVVKSSNYPIWLGDGQHTISCSDPCLVSIIEFKIQ